MVQRLFETIIEISISMSILISVLIIFGNQFRKYFSSNWRLTAFILIYARMFIPINSSLSGVPIELNLTKYSNAFTISSYIWLAGIVVLTIGYVGKYLAFLRMIRRWGYKAKNQRIYACLRNAKFETDILDVNPEIIICKKLVSPIAAGITRRRLLLPSEDYTNEELESIFRHELVHCKHYDVVRKMVGLIVCIIYWFCPFVWIMSSAVERDTELSCDTEVVFRSGEKYRSTYGKTILTSIAREISLNNRVQTPLIAAFNGKKAFLKKRIKNIMFVKRNDGGTTSMIVFSMLVIVLTIFVSVAV